MEANLVGKPAGDKMKERYIAALLGLAAGDALGFPFEGARREELAGVNLCYFERGDFPPGTWSDDTSLTFITAESLVERKGLDLADLGQRFLRWL
ncbi:MAG: ADP-ribosylglycohydrolase family protein, partial [Thermodesulfobacteria bacterium]|nr:ADP-ribosylglycohydrolase family protein [Thermodesulfobacteriota bacterium]